MTACKSMGFQVFRLDYKCKCTCHELKTTTILPAFVWRTNGTTKQLPATYSPKLYAIVGTMSPPPIETSEYDTTVDTTSATGGDVNNTDVTSDSTDNVTGGSATGTDTAGTAAATGETEAPA